MLVKKSSCHLIYFFFQLQLHSVFSDSLTSTMPSNKIVKDLMFCTNFAAIKHRNQRRKDKVKTPYINHPIGKWLVSVFLEAVWYP